MCDEAIANLPCFGTRVRKCRGAKTCTSVQAVPRLWATVFNTGCGTDLYEVDSTGRRQLCKRQSLGYDYAVIATHPQTGVVYGVGVAPEPQPNVSCDLAIEVPVFTNGLVRGNTCYGEINFPPVCATRLPSVAPGLWYKTPVFNTRRTVQFSTCSPCTTFSTWFFVYKGPCDNLVCVTDNNIGGDPFCPHSRYHASFNVDAEPGEVFYIYITGQNDLGLPANAGFFEMWFTVDNIFYHPDENGNIVQMPAGQIVDLKLVVPDVVGMACGATLFRIDPVTCQPCRIGPGLTGITTVHDVAFKNSPTGAVELYVFASDRPLLAEQVLETLLTSYSLHAIDVRTGISRKVGQVFGENDLPRVGNGLTFDCDDRLWLVSKLTKFEIPEEIGALRERNPAVRGATARAAHASRIDPRQRDIARQVVNEEGDAVNLNVQLFELNSDTGAIISQCDLTFVDFPFDFLPFRDLNPRLHALAYNKCTDKIYVTIRDIREPLAFGYDAIDAAAYLAVLDTSALTVTFVQQFSVQFVQGLTAELLDTSLRCAKLPSFVLGGGLATSFSECRKNCAERFAPELVSVPNFGQCAVLRNCDSKNCALATPRLLAAKTVISFTECGPMMYNSNESDFLFVTVGSTVSLKANLNATCSIENICGPATISFAYEMMNSTMVDFTVKLDGETILRRFGTDGSESFSTSVLAGTHALQFEFTESVQNQLCITDLLINGIAVLPVFAVGQTIPQPPIESFSTQNCEVFPLTGETVPRGDNPLKNVVFATHPRTGVVYGLGFDVENQNPQLFQVRASDGVVQVLLTTDLQGVDGVVLDDAAFKPSDAYLVDANDAILYATARSGSGDVYLLAFSLKSGAATLLATNPLGSNQLGNAIAFDSCNLLYWVTQADNTGTQPNVITVVSARDASRVSIEAVEIANSTDYTVVSLTYDACNDRMFALAETATGVQLITLDYKAGVVELIGPTVDNLSALTSELLAPRCVSAARALLADRK